MGNWFNPTEEQLRMWDVWIAERPEIVRQVAKNFQPWKLYRLTTTNHKVTLAVFDEEDDNITVTLRVNVLAEFNENLLHERRVFGIVPDDLVECDVPSFEERAVNLQNGPALSDEQVEALIDDLRVLICPDLWILDDNGIAIRK
jgi:hypothetical protein